MSSKISEILEIHHRRYACKNYDRNKKVSDENFSVIIESGRISPSSYGFEPWKFLLVENEKIKGYLEITKVDSKTKDTLKEEAVLIIEALGGAENIEDVDACITRLRVSVKDVSKVKKDELKKIGATDVLEVSGGIQAIYGAKAILYKNIIVEILGIDD